MTWAFAMQLAAYASYVWVAWLQGHKSKWAPWVNLVSCVPWVAMAALNHLPYFVAFEVCLTGLAIRQVVLWRKSSTPN